MKHTATKGVTLSLDKDSHRVVKEDRVFPFKTRNNKENALLQKLGEKPTSIKVKDFNSRYEIGGGASDVNTYKSTQRGALYSTDISSSTVSQ
jgi:hypothetical protein